jgi:hypothetical protein
MVAYASPCSSFCRLQTARRLTHEYELKDELDKAWVARVPWNWCATAIMLEDPGGELLDRLPRRPLETGQFLCTEVDATNIGIVISWAMPIEPEPSSTGSATTSRKRPRKRIVSTK